MKRVAIISTFFLVSFSTAYAASGGRAKTPVVPPSWLRSIATTPTAVPVVISLAWDWIFGRVPYGATTRGPGTSEG